jgi:hypothetical protein
LVLTINKPDGTELAEAGSMWLDLEEVTNMFERAHIENVTTTFPDMVNTTNVSAFQSDYTLNSNPDEAKQLVVFVHGWRMTENDYQSFSSTMFKRLWWQSYKGRFAALRWPTLSAETDSSVGQYYMDYWFNPSGSRNLEFDPSKVINP